MKPVATIPHGNSSFRLGKINWQFLVFWLTYLSMIAGFVVRFL